MTDSTTDTSKILHDLTLTPLDARDQNWETQFLNALPHAKVSLLFSVPQVAQDNWPYMFVKTDPHGTEPLAKLMDWAARRGIGIAVNPQKKEELDYLLSYGMVWSQVFRGSVARSSTTAPEGQFEIAASTQLQAGSPSEDFLPAVVRGTLRTFLQEQGLLQPKILIMSTDQKHYDLCFSLDSLESPPESEHRGIAEALSWFLPPDYSIVLCHEKGLPTFHNL